MCSTKKKFYHAVLLNFSQFPQLAKLFLILSLSLSMLLLFSGSLLSLFCLIPFRYSLAIITSMCLSLTTLYQAGLTTECVMFYGLQSLLTYTIQFGHRYSHLFIQSFVHSFIHRTLVKCPVYLRYWSRGEVSRDAIKSFCSQETHHLVW